VELVLALIVREFLAEGVSKKAADTKHVTSVWPQRQQPDMDSQESTREYAMLPRWGEFSNAPMNTSISERSRELPDINLAHLHLLSDDTGILQHAAFSVPRYEDGYCVDDNARALLLTALLVKNKPI
jgi:hypothetical protein